MCLKNTDMACLWRGPQRTKKPGCANSPVSNGDMPSAYSLTALSTLTLTPGPIVELSETFFM